MNLKWWLCLCYLFKECIQQPFDKIIYKEHRIVKRDVNGSDSQTTELPTTEQQVTGDDITTTDTTSQQDGPKTTTETGTTNATPEPSNVTTEEDHHVYYKSRFISDQQGYYWNELQGHTRHDLSNDKHLLLSFVSLSFTFPFYGHPIDLLAITTQGFLYMSSFSHPSLDYTFTHYLAPLMANFDTIGNYSDILYKDDGNRFVVEWRNVELNDQVEYGNYTFQTTLFKNGTILFSYKSIPNTNISSSQLSVKVGLSDAFYYDYQTFFGYVRSVYRYHTVSFDVNRLRDNSVIIIDPLPTCNLASSCSECTTIVTNFTCGWCSAISKCSDGLDRHKQAWLEADCKNKAVFTSTSCSSSSITTTASPTFTNKPSDSPDAVFISDDAENLKRTSASKERSGSKKIAVIVVPMVIAVILIFVFIGVWVFYARTHPNTKSGRWLIEHRPKNLKAKLYSVKFNKESGNNDKVNISDVSEMTEVDT